MADKVARALNFLGADRDLLDSADGDAFLDLIDEYLDDPEGIATPVNPTFNYTRLQSPFIQHNINNNVQGYVHCIDLCTIYIIDLDTSTAAVSTDPPEDDEQLNQDPPVDDPPAEDDEEDEEEPVDEPTAAEILQAGVAQGQLDETVSIDQRVVDEAEELLIEQFARDGCKCDLGPNRSPCCTTITVAHYRSVRCQMLELTHDELDLVVMGQVMAGCFSGETSLHRG